MPSSDLTRLKARLCGLLVIFVFMVGPIGPASAQEVEIFEIHEVSLGATDSADAQYVVIHLENAYDADVLWIEVRDATGALIGDFGNLSLPLGAEGFFAVGTPAAGSHYDLEFLGSSFVPLPASGGRICLVWDDDIWFHCLTYGDYDDGSDEWGQPAPAPAPGEALTRVERTGDSLVDFTVGVADPSPYTEPVDVDPEPEGPSGPLPGGQGPGGGDLIDEGCGCSATGPGGTFFGLALLALGIVCLGRRRRR